MAFSDSYIALCRTLQLEHNFAEGDFWFDADKAHHGPMLIRRLPGQPGPGLTVEAAKPDVGVIWLPRDDDWIRMLLDIILYKKDYLLQLDYYYAVDGWSAMVVDMSTPLGYRVVDSGGSFSSTTEALGRLWARIKEQKAQGSLL